MRKDEEAGMRQLWLGGGLRCVDRHWLQQKAKMKSLGWTPVRGS